MTTHRIKVGDIVKVSFEGRVEELSAHDGCVKIVAEGYNHYAYLPTTVTLGAETYSGVTVETAEVEFVTGKAYQDADGDVFLRTSNGWMTAGGIRKTHDYATRPLKLLTAES